MDSWSPATKEQVASIVGRDLCECPESVVELYRLFRTPLRAVPIKRFDNIESVIVVAERDGVVIYYEDVEEGFNISSLAPDGSIASPVFEQWSLLHALLHFEA